MVCVIKNVCVSVATQRAPVPDVLAVDQAIVKDVLPGSDILV